jgi:hypothetical protein
MFHSCVYDHPSACWVYTALKESEAIVLRTYPLRETDLLVALFTHVDKVPGTFHHSSFRAVRKLALHTLPAN